jgi:hypothetical protein
VLQGKILEIFKHVNPQISSDHVIDIKRLAPRVKLGQDIPKQSSAVTTQRAAPAGQTLQVSPPVLIKLSSISLAQELLKQGNKKLKTYSNPRIRVVDDISKITQEKRATLIPRMKELRSAGLFAMIPFGPVAKIIYKQDNEWKTIYPEQ